MTRVLLLTTGGTIASRRGDQGLEPQISARGLLEYMSDLRAHYHIDARDIQPDEDNKETTTSQTYLQKLADRGGEKLLAQLRTGSIEFSVEDDSLQVGDVLRVSLPQLGYTAMVRVADIITESQDSGTTRTLRLGTPTWHKT